MGFHTVAMKSLSHYAVLVLLLLALIYVLLQNAYVIDDAYITFRTIDNFLNGHGLRWNVDERVQVYTHPLWMLVLSAVVFFTGEFHVTSMAVAFVFAVSSVLLVCAILTDFFQRNLWKAGLFVLLFLASKAALDYSSSGLENPLSHFLCIVFLGIFLSDEATLERRWPALFLVASLAFITRYDNIIFLLPSLIFVFFKYGVPSRKRYVWLAICVSPAMLWLLFSLFYYGFAFPNTAYAKSFNNGIGLWESLSRGGLYLLHNVIWDFIAYGLLMAGMVFSYKRRNIKLLLLYAGLVSYIFYVVVVAASATHMAGRFFSTLNFVGVVLFLYQVKTPRYLKRSVVFLIVFLILNPGSAIRFGTKSYSADQLYDPSRIDIKTGIYIYDTAPQLSNWDTNATKAGNVWYKEGVKFSRSKPRVSSGNDRRQAIGYFGFYAGADKFIIDSMALADPLLSKFPPSNRGWWKSGHFRRLIPEGYRRSVRKNRNAIVHKDLNEYYEVLRSITRGDLFSRQRLAEIVKMNMGHYDYLIDNYVVSLR